MKDIYEKLENLFIPATFSDENSVGEDLYIENRSIREFIPLTDLVCKFDSNSRTLKFKIKRYFDSIDLSEKDIKINFINANSRSGYTIGILDEINQDDFTFLWTISDETTVESGRIYYAIQFSSIENNVKYLWHTKPSSFLVEDSLVILNDVIPTDYTRQQTFYNENDNETRYLHIQDMDTPIQINNRVILIGEQKDLVVSTDNKSQILSFKIPRYFQGTDLATKLICINFINAQGYGDMSHAVNVNLLQLEIEFSWLLDSRVSVSAGEVLFSISFIGYNEKDEWYLWSTKISKFNVEQGILIEESIPNPEPSWLQSLNLEIVRLQNNISELENKVELLQSKLNSMS